ncbi:MAG: phosphoribosylformylglycinamidine cyclo-ligase [Planctomycetes bacterium]|nr:phosphoribosylformylglycinamidine cyclo-ligase [Planctomycetota bacterium]
MPSVRSKKANLTYRSAGVDISANDEMVDKIGHALKRTYDPRVLSRHNAFAGLMQLDFREPLLRRNYKDPVLVSGADGVGSKLLLAMKYQRVEGLGIDLVAMNVNDVLTCGAEPLFFLDYIACHKLEPTWIAAMVESISRGCNLANCALLGGETAELPDLYSKGHFDLAGFCVGVVEKRRIIDGRDVEPGDEVLGLASSGLHSNGYALARKALASLPTQAKVQLGEPLIDAALRPTRIYVKSIQALLRFYRRKRVVKAMAHITGGGLAGNVPRVIPANCDVQLSRKSWPIPPIFRLIQSAGVAQAEMFRVFNMGIGFVVVVRRAFADTVAAFLEKSGERVYRIGTIRRGSGRLIWR